MFLIIVVSLVDYFIFCYCLNKMNCIISKIIRWWWLLHVNYFGFMPATSIGCWMLHTTR